MRLNLRRRAALFSCIVLIGCAGAKVGQEIQSAPAPTNAPPSQIVIYPFAVDSSDVSLNSSIFQRAYRNISDANVDAQQTQIAHDTAENVCLKVVTALSAKGYNAVCQKRGVPPGTGNILIVEGEFTDISEGNRLRRLVIGFGAGASKLDTDVYLYQPTDEGQRQLIAFNTHADSGMMPGAAITGPAGAAAGGAAAAATLGANVAMSGGKTITSSTGFLADKTSDQIVKTLTQYFAQQGWPA
jgi:Domain of unknown function (DUF4410)